MIYTLTLNPAIDYVVQLDHALAPGNINRSQSEAYQFGGKGINVSTVLHALGVDTVALGFVAGFTGLGLEQGLQESGITTRFIHLPQGNTRINVKVKGSEETEINGAGPQIPDAAMNELLHQLDALLPGDTLVLSGSVPKCLDQTVYGQILCRLQHHNVQFVVDAAGPLLTHALPYLPFLIKPNLPELESLFAVQISSDSQIVACARQLQQKGARNVLVSLAGDGALLLDETGHTHRLSCPGGQVINSVGAGDSMVAGFLAGWQQAGDYAYALKLGIAAGSATAFSLGLADKAAIEALL